MNRKVSFLHIGDIHFDSKFLGLDEEKRSIRRLEIQKTLKRVIVENDDAKIVFFAGDIFDGEADNSTIIFLCKLFKDNADKHFFIVGGNHDYLSNNSMQHLSEHLPQNAHLFSDTMSFVDLENYGVRVYGCSFLNMHCFSSMLEKFSIESSDKVNIMLMHGEINPAGQYNPIKLSQIAESGLDYLALGHEHLYSGIRKHGKTTYAYPGILEPRGFDECGKCGIIKGYISKGNISAEFIPCCTREYQIIDVDITNLSTDLEIIEKINEVLNKENLYRVTLCGKKSPEFVLKLSLYEQMVDAFYCEISDKTQNSMSILDFTGENSLAGKTASILNSYIESHEFDDDILSGAIDVLTELLCIGGKE